MIHVTERAREILNEILKETLDEMLEEPDMVLRLGATDSGLGVYLDKQNEDDQVVEHEGRAVLLISSELSTALGGKTIDAEEAADGSHIVLRR
ncbi:MAG: hypothetical protein AAB295_08130 [Chloroflexota bacterium]